jgi:hypothetical protein
MDEYGNGERPIDVFFAGGYSRHHVSRARTLELVAGEATNVRIGYYLDASRLTRLAESAIGRWLPLKEHRRPSAVAKIAQPPVFGRELYELAGSSKIVLNGAIDMAGEDRGNMRCFEAMGCGALLLSDAGHYPDGMEPGRTIVTYATSSDCIDQIDVCLRNWDQMKEKAEEGRRSVKSLYSKERQWALFQQLS